MSDLAPDPPRPVRWVAEVMRDFGPWWALCGGWAVDAWIGQQTREHADVDIAVFIDDQKELFDHLRRWQLIAHDPNVPGDTSELWNGRKLDLPAHVHARPAARTADLPDRLRAPAKQGFGLDIQFDERAGEDLVLSREPPVTVSVKRSAGRSPWDVPALRPAVLLFHKARGHRPADDADFRQLRGQLDAQDRAWLAGSISTVAPDHAWLTPEPERSIPGVIS